MTIDLARLRSDLCAALLSARDADELASLLQEALRPGELAAWSTAAPAAAAPYEWTPVLDRAEPLIFAS